MKRVLLVTGLSFMLGCPLQTSKSSTMPTGGGGAPNQGGGGEASGNVTVPDVVGKTQSEAEAAVASAGLRGGLRFGNDPGTWDASTKICTQTPGGGQQSSASLFVSVRFCSAAAVVNGRPELAGLSVADATKLAKAKGFEGKIEVIEQHEFNKDCKADTVCGYTPNHWDANQSRTLTLYINRKLAIGTPE
jgi:beta-lactam-binding protein with PASTA domain